MTTTSTLQTTALAITLLTCAPTFAKKAAPVTAPTTTTAQEAEAAYAQAIERRTQEILAALDLAEAGAAGRVHDTIVTQYRALRDWHDANDPKLKELAKHADDQSARAEIESIEATRRALHDRFIADLSAPLAPAQVEKVKDKMTYDKVRVTYDGYREIVPNLTAPELARIMELLKAAREEAMDGGSAEEKSAVFKKYKGKINNYLSGNGHDVAQAYKDWGERQKAKAATRSVEPVGTEKD